MENLIYLSYLPFFLFFVKEKNKVGVILCCWILNIFIIRNIKKLYIKKYEFILIFLRRILYLFPLFFYFFIFGFTYNINLSHSVFYGFFLGFLFLIPNLKKYSLFLSKDYLILTSKPKS